MQSGYVRSLAAGEAHEYRARRHITGGGAGFGPHGGHRGRSDSGTILWLTANPDTRSLLKPTSLGPQFWIGPDNRGGTWARPIGGRHRRPMVSGDWHLGRDSGSIPSIRKVADASAACRPRRNPSACPTAHRRRT